MSLMSEEQRAKLEATKEQNIKQRKQQDLVYDRWSIVFILLIVAIIVTFIILKKGKLGYAFLPLSVPLVAGTLVGLSSAKIRRNEYEGAMYFKGEKDCGFSTEVKTDIDGILIKKQVGLGQYQKRIFKAPNGTDIIIDKEGNIFYVGFGSKFISKIRNNGYLNAPPNDCWEISK